MSQERAKTEMTEGKVKLTYKEKRPIADDAVHETFVECSRIVNAKILSLRAFDFEDEELFYTQQRIVNRIYLAYNKIVFQAADAVNKEALNETQGER